MPSTQYSLRLFFFNAPPTTYIYTLSLHDALPIFQGDLLAKLGMVAAAPLGDVVQQGGEVKRTARGDGRDRKSTRLNSSHSSISYAVFCLKKKKKTQERT